MENVTVSAVSWIIMHVVTVFGVLLTAATLGITVWQNALAGAQRNKERLAYIEALAASFPPEITSSVDMLGSAMQTIAELAQGTADLLRSLVDGDIDYGPPPADPPLPPESPVA